MTKTLSMYLIGLDLTNVDLTNIDTNEAFEPLERLSWLTIDKTNVTHIPQTLKKLTKIERLSMSHNKIKSLATSDWYSTLNNLQIINARKNQITNDGLPLKLLANPQLEVVDLSYNELTEIPLGLLEAKGLLVLNLSNNKITSVPKELFFNCASLMVIDLSNNEISTFPTNLRRMPNLQTLNLSNNPMPLSQLRSICGLKKLQILDLSNTSRRYETFPPDLDRLTMLTDLDISNNNLPRLPQTVYEIKSLVKLNLSGNQIEELNNIVDDNWHNLETLNLSKNKLKSLPSFITRLSKLKRLYVDGNHLTFSGIPIGMGKLLNLQVFSATDNNLENIPEGLCRCGQLRCLNLRNNRLVTLPDAIHFLIENLTTFNVDNNPNLKMPPKLDESTRQKIVEYYNADFSLDTQMKQVTGQPERSDLDKEVPQKDTASRIRRLRRRKLDESADGDNGSSKCVLEGMQKIAKDRDAVLEEREREQMITTSSKRWQDSLNKQDLDYSKLYDEFVGSEEGVEMWDIAEFSPRVYDELMQGTFYNGDCYIILHTQIDNNHQFLHKISYWIGQKATLDKITCSAMHAVSLRNFVRAETRCERIEQGDEPSEFLDLFGGKIDIIDGPGADSGFSKYVKADHQKRLYRVYGGSRSISLYACDVVPQSLDSKYAYLFDYSETQIFIWVGRHSSIMLRKKARLLAEKIIQKERKNECDLCMEKDGEESSEFQNGLNDPDDTINWKQLDRNWVPSDWSPSKPILFEIQLGVGILIMSQIPLPVMSMKLSKNLLLPGHVYILEAAGCTFVWIGSSPSTFLKYASFKVAEEFIETYQRNNMRRHILCFQNSEPYVFKMQFYDWEDTITVDFTKNMEIAPKNGGDVVDKDEKLKTDMKAFFAPREKPVSWEEAAQIMDECNEELVIVCNPEDENAPTNAIDNPFISIKQFVYEKRRWVPVEERWMGHFFTEDCYIIHAEYWDYPDEDEEEEEVDENDEENEGPKPRISAVVYFWQGRQASNIPWLQFNFSMLKEMESRLSLTNHDANGSIKRKVEFKRMLQQQEMSQFMAHFRYRFIVHQGRFSNRLNEVRENSVQMYCLRDNGNPLCARTIEIAPITSYLNSCFHYIVKVPKRITKTDKNKILCWLGEKSNKNYDEIVQDIASSLITSGEAENEVVIVREGEEPDYFWGSMIGGKKPYDKEADFINYSRLFRLSNEQGFFCASEKCSDFCQDDLADDDVMLLDTGTQIYLWFGSRTSEVEKKLSLKAAKLYHEHISRYQPDHKRSLKVTSKKMEPHNFRRCFHGWGTFKEAKDWSG